MIWERIRSLPTRERGLKSVLLFNTNVYVCVAPYAGAWIEMMNQRRLKRIHMVAPYAGAWIEI